MGCNDCPSNTYSSTVGNSEIYSCLSCLSGTYSTGTGLTQCQPCQIGTEAIEVDYSLNYHEAYKSWAITN